MANEKFEIIIKATCGCVDGQGAKIESTHTGGIRDTDEDKTGDLGDCGQCGEPRKKKKKIKRRIDAKTKLIIPDDEVTAL